MSDNAISSGIEHTDTNELNTQEVLSYQMHNQLIILIHEKLTEISGRELIAITEVQDLLLDLIIQIQKDPEKETVLV